MSRLTRRDLDEIKCFITFPNCNFLNASKYLYDHYALPCVEKKYSYVLDQLQISHRDSIFDSHCVEYYNRKCSSFSEFEIPVYSNLIDRYVITNNIFVPLPSKVTIEAARALENMVNTHVSLSAKYEHNLSLIGTSLVAYTTEKVYAEVQSVFSDEDEIYIFPVGRSSSDGKFYYILFNKSKITRNSRLRLMVPAHVTGMFVGNDAKNIRSWKKELGFRWLKIKELL